MEICPPTEQERLDNQYTNMRNLARNIYRLRKEKEMSQRDLAIKAGVQIYQISYLEWQTPHYKKSKKDGKLIVENKYYCVSFKTICLIARALGVHVSTLVSD